MTDHTDAPMSPRPPPKAWRAVALALALVGLGIVGGVYVLHGFPRNPQSATCGSALDLARRVAPLARGEVAAVVVASEPRTFETIAFTDGEGRARTLADWKGRTVLLNIWATWCVPCRKEMPALDRLQRDLGGPAFEVVAVNADTRNPEKPRAWLKDNGIDRLAFYADPTGKVLRDLGVFGLPTTILIDPAGCAVATLAGPAEWASDDAFALVRAALAR